MAQLKDLIVTGASRFLGNIYGTLKGNADSATKATQDSAGQQIDTTYIKGLSVSGKTITYTKGNGTTSTITTQDTNTTYSAGTGLSLSGTTFNHKNSVTAATAQGDANKTLTFGGTFTIPTVTYDAQGHITSKGTTTMTMPANPNTDTKVTQTAIKASDYTNWRPLVWGASNSGTEGFTPSTITDGVYTAQTLSCQPSSGTIRANTFKGSLSGNANTATKLKTARTISLSGGATGTATSFDGSSNISVPITSISPNYISDGYTTKGFYINTHPENSPTIIPFINNDIAFLLKRGGSAVVKYDGAVQSVDVSNVFDGSPSYWYMNPNGVTNIVIELTLHKVFTWTNTIYIDSGSNGWRAKNVKIEVMNTNYADDIWTQKGMVANHPYSQYKVTFSHKPVGASNEGGGFNKIRLTFSGWNSSTIFRIAAIGVINYGSSGLRETFLPKDGGSVYGDINPYSNNTFNLGSSSNKWKNIYATTFIGALSGNASTATNVAWSGITNKPSYYDAKAIKSISRNGTTFTATHLDGTTSTFTQQDNDTHYTTRLYTGASGAASAHAATNNPYLTVTDNNTYRNQVRFIGSGATTIKSDTSGNITISSTNTTYSAFTGATSSAAGKVGLVPAPASGKTNLFLRSDGTWYDLIAIDGTTLDTFAELKAAWEGADSTLTTTLNNAIGAKQNTITGAATTITSSNLTTNRALISNNSGKVAASSVTSTELGYLSGVTSAIQTQLNARVSSVSASSTAPLTLSGSISSGKLTLTGSIANASTSAAGVITTSTQSFAGLKTFTSGLFINTNSGTNPLTIARYNNTGESTKFYQDDQSFYIDMTNDETSCTTQFKYKATDTENSDGSNAHTATITMGMNASGATYVTAGTFNGNLAANYITGTLSVAHGGTGKTTLTSGEALIGAGTGAVTTRGINNMTAKSYIAYDTKLMTTNTLAYWNGAYASNGASNLTYCNQGAFGNVVTKSYTDSSSASAIGTGTSVPTERDIYYGLPTINNSHAYTSSTTIYAPSAGGSAGQYLKAVGATSTPTWVSFAGLTIKTKDVAGTETTKVNAYTPATAASTIIGPDDIFKIYSYSATKALSLNTWTDMATAANLGSPTTGTYILQVTAGGAIYSGVMSWDSSTTAATGIYDEILLHSASTSSAHVTARVNRDGSLRLQLCALDAVVASGTITIKMRRMI